MTNICPGAIYQPISASLFGGRARRRKGRAFVSHVAVSEAANLKPSSSSADWHFYVPREGPNFYQYVDLDFVAYAQLDGNADCVSAESQGGVHNPDSEPWSPFQVATFAHILKYLHDSEGIPLRLMQSSAAGEKGFGYHRLGIDPWRQAGTQRWSSSRGKLCPGAAKIAQCPQIVAIAGGAQAPAQAPQAPAAPASGTPPRLSWNLPAGHYYGNIAGPARSHGGYYPAERDFVRNIQQWLIWHQCVTGNLREDWATSGWADGKWEQQTDWAMGTWHERFYPGQPKPYECWSDDYDRLARP